MLESKGYRIFARHNHGKLQTTVPHYTISDSLSEAYFIITYNYWLWPADDADSQSIGREG